MPAGRPCKFGSRLSNGKCPPNPSKPAKGTGKRGRPAGTKNKTRKSPKGKSTGKWELIRIHSTVPTIVRGDTWKNANKEGYYAIDSIECKIDGHSVELDFTEQPPLPTIYINGNKETSSLSSVIKNRNWPRITKASLGSSSVTLNIIENDRNGNYETTEENIIDVKNGDYGKLCKGMKHDEDEATIINDVKNLIVKYVK